MDFFQTLTTQENAVIAILAAVVVVLSTVVVFQWKHTANKTVPRWIWDELMGKVNKNVDTLTKLGTIIDERLKK